MEYFKLQIGCLAVVFFIIFIYHRQIGINKNPKNYSLFTAIYITAIFEIIFDGITSYTVNHLESINHTLQLIFHLCFFIGINFLIYLMFIYILSITDRLPKKIFYWIIISLPLLVNLVIMIFNLNSLEFVEGKITNYSIGIPAQTCFLIIFLYSFLTFFSFIKRWKYIEKRKTLTIFIYLIVALGILIIQSIYPEILITSIAPVIFVLGLYLNHEDPAVQRLKLFNQNTVIDFATLVENRDNNTGGHIKRTTAYVKLLLEELKNRKPFNKIITKDFSNYLEMAAPLHDIGKIGTPDAILQKPGKLSDEEYAIMKLHSENGATIIRDTFGKHGDEDFIKIAYSVAMYHHEKWNGKGYPEGLSGEEIPISARIMAIADVYDALTMERVYKKAFPVETALSIISEDAGKHFDPLLAPLFVNLMKSIWV